MRGRRGAGLAGSFREDEDGRFDRKGSCTRRQFSRIQGAGLCSRVCLAAILLAPGLWAQLVDEVHVVPRSRGNQAPPTGTGPSRQNSAAKRLRVDVDLVLVHTTVTDHRNRPIVDLEKQNFGIYEDNAQQQIRYFGEEDAPISVGLILDVSRSMSNKIDTERRAVAEFLKNANPQDDYFVITLADRPQLIADTTESLEEIEHKLALVVPDGHTALLDAIYLGVSKMRTARYPRRALLIISDGGDNHSHYTGKETKSMVEESDVLVYGIGIFDTMPMPVFKTLEERLGERLLTEITTASGGRTIPADKREKVPEIASALSWELRQQYVLGYKSSNGLHDGKWRTIKVRVTAAAGDPPLRAHYKRGYLAPEK
jgi:Ca-activated chloride channel homolog